MIAITVAAIVLGLAVTLQGLVPFVILSIVWGVIPTPLVICAIFGRGDIQAFAIGALIPWVLVLRGPPGVGLLPFVLLMPAVCGVVAVVTYRWVRSGE
jgi:hypothetical protein